MTRLASGPVRCASILMIPRGLFRSLAAFAYDQDALRQIGTTNRGLVNKSETVSEFGSAYATFGEAGALYLLGALKHNEHLRETGILGAEAVANASLVAEGLKLATNRERPNDGLGTGRFWPHGTHNNSLDSFFRPAMQPPVGLWHGSSPP